MSRYIKLEDAISKIVNTPTRVITDDLTALVDRQHEIIDMLADLPTIEVSEDCVSREYILGEAFASDEYNRETKSFDLPVVSVSDIEDAPSVVPNRAEGEWKITNTYKDHNGRVVDRVEHTDCGFIWHREMGEPLHNYCPNCGAKMKGAGE